MVGNDGIEIIVENYIHGFDLHRTTIAFEDMIDAFGRIVLPSVNLALIAGLVKTVGMHFVELIHIFQISYDMVIGMFTGRRIEIADDQIASDAEMQA